MPDSVGVAIANLQCRVDKTYYDGVRRDSEVAKDIRLALDAVVNPLQLSLSRERMNHEAGHLYDLSPFADNLGKLEELYDKYVTNGSDVKPFKTGDLEEVSEAEFDEIYSGIEALNNKLKDKTSDTSHALSLFAQTYLMIANILKKAMDTQVRCMERSGEKSLPR